MRDKSSTKAIVESGILTAVTVVLILISLYIPVFYMIGIFLWPLPATFIYIRHGAKYSIMSLVVAGIITAISYDPISALNITATFGLMSIVLGYCIKNKKDFSFSVILMSAAMFISLILVLKIFSVSMGQDIVSMLTEQINQMREMATSMYSQMGVPKETQELALSAFPTAELFKKMFPIGLLIGSITMAFISYTIARKVFKKFGYDISNMKPLSSWYMPVQLAIGIIVLVLLAYIMVYFKIKNADILFINTSLLMQFAFLIDGVATVDFFMKKKGVTKGLRIFILIFLIFSQIGKLLFFIGIVDYALNLRKLDITRS
ncbi:MAG: YybS family protein [Caloramator sp.]|nr:YybS family protein [Caloramator sp.]